MHLMAVSVPHYDVVLKEIILLGTFRSPPPAVKHFFFPERDVQVWEGKSTLSVGWWKVLDIPRDAVR